MLLDQIQKVSGIDRWTFRVAISLLGAIAIVAAICMVVVSFTDKADTFNQGLTAIASGAVGALGGMLVRPKD